MQGDLDEGEWVVQGREGQWNWDLGQGRMEVWQLSQHWEGLSLLVRYVTTCAQPPRTDLSHGARTFSEVGTGCTATSHMTSLLVYSLFSWELSSLSLNLILDIPKTCDITP